MSPSFTNSNCDSVQNATHHHTNPPYKRTPSNPIPRQTTHQQTPNSQCATEQDPSGYIVAAATPAMNFKNPFGYVGKQSAMASDLVGKTKSVSWMIVPDSKVVDVSGTEIGQQCRDAGMHVPGPEMVDLVGNEIGDRPIMRCPFRRHCPGRVLVLQDEML